MAPVVLFSFSPSAAESICEYNETGSGTAIHNGRRMQITADIVIAKRSQKGKYKSAKRVASNGEERDPTHIS